MKLVILSQCVLDVCHFFGYVLSDPIPMAFHLLEVISFERIKLRRLLSILLVRFVKVFLKVKQLLSQKTKSVVQVHVQLRQVLLLEHVFVVTFFSGVFYSLVQSRIILYEFLREHIVITSQILESYFELAMLEEQWCNTSCHEFSDQRLQHQSRKLVRVRFLVEEKLVKRVNLDFSV